jgi:cell division protein FtsL
VAAAAPAQARPQRAAPARAPASRPRRAPARRARPAARPRVAGGVLWIVLIAALLAGIVAVNVAALRLNLESQRLDTRQDELLTENAAAASKLSSLASASRIEATAVRELGLERAGADSVVYVAVRPGRK